ncbi:hypothetical protein CRG98_007290 [Punica granatum]|uniref:Uncharacterized protein n=1 Tax=Punica granatum TaxID=22663 RepID=A0A2I0KV17_PUNGR|nr:hypothetical protein CRG98_007289 [Punica granatum]PKI72310.1 hypothetical protein CRG98_007290 [Punica granatum]
MTSKQGAITSKEGRSASAAGTGSSTPKTGGGTTDVFSVNHIIKETFQAAVMEGPYFPHPGRTLDNPREGEMVIWVDHVPAGLRCPMYKDVVDICKYFIIAPTPNHIQLVETVLASGYWMGTHKAPSLDREIAPSPNDPSNGGGAEAGNLEPPRGRRSPRGHSYWTCSNG